MKQYLPVIGLVALVAAEAFLKHTLAGSRLFPVALVTFVLCVAYFLYYYSVDSRVTGLWDSFLTPSRPIRWSGWIIAGIVLMGALFRFWKLGTLFEGMAWDEAYKGLDAIAIREFGERPVYLDWNAGREALIAYLVAGSQYFFDYSIVSVRFVLALAGTLTLIFFYLFVKQVFNQNLALLSTFLMAVSKWHIIHSRYAVRVALIVLFEVAALYFASRAVSTKKKNSLWLVLVGAVVGLGFYTYIAFRIFPLVIVIFLFQENVRVFWKQHWKTILAGTIAFIVVLFPLAKFFAVNSASLTERISRTAVWSAAGTKDEQPAQLVLQSTLQTLGLFTYKGDSIDRHNIADEPELSSFSTAFFVLGVIITFANIRKKYASFLILYSLLTLLPGFLSVQAPQVSRTLGCVAPAMLFTAFGIAGAIQILLAATSIVFTKAVLAVILAGNLLTGPNDALLRYAQTLDTLPPKVSSLYGMDRDQANIARLLNQLGTRCDAFVSPQFYYHATVEYLTYSKSKHQLFTIGTNLDRTAAGKIAVIILQPHESNMWWLRDDDGKSFFKWWRQGHGMDAKKVRATIFRNYAATSKLTRMSDYRLISYLKKYYPHAKELNLGWFTVYIIKTKS